MKPKLWFYLFMIGLFVSGLWDSYIQYTWTKQANKDGCRWVSSTDSYSSFEWADGVYVCRDGSVRLRP